MVLWFQCTWHSKVISRFTSMPLVVNGTSIFNEVLAAIQYLVALDIHKSIWPDCHPPAADGWSWRDHGGSNEATGRSAGLLCTLYAVYCSANAARARGAYNDIIILALLIPDMGHRGRKERSTPNRPRPHAPCDRLPGEG